MKKNSIKKLAGVTLHKCLARWYLEKGRDPLTIPECYCDLSGYENKFGFFVVTRHKPFYLPIRNNKNKIVDYGYIPKNAWCGQVFGKGELVQKKTKSHKRWSNQLR